jgi:metallo-beta-lactamase class B
MRVSLVANVAASAAFLAGLAAAAQQPPAAPAKPDPPEIVAMIEQAKKAAAPEFTEAVHFWCEAPRANRPDDPPIAPTKIFDDVYAIGNSGTTVYVVRTSAGLLMIDALLANQVESQLLPGFQALGLDPAQVKIILVTHGHADHFGGSQYFQEHFGSKLYVSSADWMLMENPPARGGRGPAGPPANIPKHDADIVDGQSITLGDFSVRPVAVPGHTPGSMAFIFPVKDNGQSHTAALFGGAWLTPNILSDMALETFAASVSRFRAATSAARVDTLLQNHMLMVPIQQKLDLLAKRKRGEPNPFVVGAAGYQKFVDVMAACTNVNLARRR